MQYYEINTLYRHFCLHRENKMVDSGVIEEMSIECSETCYFC
jgi:hypothetical protein